MQCAIGMLLWLPVCTSVRTWGPMPKTTQMNPATCRASKMSRRSHAVAIMPSRICSQCEVSCLTSYHKMQAIA